MLRWLIRRIRMADEHQIGVILEEAVKRYNALYPQWEIITLSVKRSNNRAEQLERTIRMLRSMLDAKD